jgi:hypothetical protein
MRKMRNRSKALLREGRASWLVLPYVQDTDRVHQLIEGLSMKRIIPTVDCPLYDAKTERCGQVGFADPCPLAKKYHCPKSVTTEFVDHSGEGIHVGEERTAFSKERP